EKATHWMRGRPPLIALLVLVAVTGVCVGFWLSRQVEDTDEANQVKVAYFNGFIRRWRVPEGVGPLSDAQVSRRDVSYKFYSRGGRVEKVEAVTRHGRLTTVHAVATYLDKSAQAAGNQPERDCSWEYDRDQKGDLVKEVARDRRGQVVWEFQFT